MKTTLSALAAAILVASVTTTQADTATVAPYYPYAAFAVPTQQQIAAQQKAWQDYYTAVNKAWTQQLRTYPGTFAYAPPAYAFPFAAPGLREVQNQFATEQQKMVTQMNKARNEMLAENQRVREQMNEDLRTPPTREALTKRMEERKAALDKLIAEQKAESEALIQKQRTEMDKQREEARAEMDALRAQYDARTGRDRVEAPVPAPQS